MNEKLSALMDGELDEAEAHLVLSRLRSSEDYRKEWSDYHLISDALRSHARLNTDMTARVMEGLLEEPVVLAPVPSRKTPPLQRTLAMAASVAGITLVAALAWSGRPAAVTEVAQIPASAQVPPQLASVDLQAYLVAHQTHAPSASVQGAAHYIKTVSVDMGGR